METTGVHGYVLDALAWLPPEVVLVLDSVHIWFPLLTLFAFFFFGPAAAHQGSRVGNRAWLAFSTAVTVRQLVLWFVGLPPVKGMLLAVGWKSYPRVDGGRRAQNHTGCRIRAEHLHRGQVRASEQRTHRLLQVRPTHFKILNPHFFPFLFRSSAESSPAAFADFSLDPLIFRQPRRGGGAAEGLQGVQGAHGGHAREATPVEANGEWSEMMNKSGVGFSYRARGGTCSLTARSTSPAPCSRTPRWRRCATFSTTTT